MTTQLKPLVVGERLRPLHEAYSALTRQLLADALQGDVAAARQLTAALQAMGALYQAHVNLAGGRSPAAALERVAQMLNLAAFSDWTGGGRSGELLVLERQAMRLSGNPWSGPDGPDDLYSPGGAKELP